MSNNTSGLLLAAVQLPIQHRAFNRPFIECAAVAIDLSLGSYHDEFSVLFLPEQNPGQARLQLPRNNTEPVYTEARARAWFAYWQSQLGRVNKLLLFGEPGYLFNETDGILPLAKIPQGSRCLDLAIEVIRQRTRNCA